mmetsp:Transcript_21690/g.31564  ORF Transcript_21690/g.31564 Transcript_21690/m.31564 type:complete len:275 (+) Transcript_21690:41-865(+)
MSDEFSREVTRRAVARACLALDYKNAQSSALDSLADVVKHFIQTVGVEMHNCAETSGRADPGIFDCKSALSAVEGSKMPIWRELQTFAFGSRHGSTGKVSTVWCQPFPGSVPTFPTATPLPATVSVPASAECVAPKHKSLSHLPALPPSRTYSRTPGSAEEGLKYSEGKRKAAEVGLSEGSKRARRIQASKNIQASLARLDTHDASATEESKASNSDTEEVNGGPGLPVAATDGGSSALNVVIDKSASVVSTLPKEEQLLLGLQDDAQDGESSQ